MNINLGTVTIVHLKKIFYVHELASQKKEQENGVDILQQQSACLACVGSITGTAKAKTTTK